VTPKRRKNRNRKTARTKRALGRERLIEAGFYCVVFGVDGYGLVQVFQHWRTYGDVHFDPGITTMLIVLTFTALLSRLLISSAR